MPAERQTEWDRRSEAAAKTSPEKPYGSCIQCGARLEQDDRRQCCYSCYYEWYVDGTF